MNDTVYKQSPVRSPMHFNKTGIYVRAQKSFESGFGAVDLVDLELHSLKLWLRSRGEKNTFAERTLALVLGHDPYAVDKEWGDD